MTHIGKCLTSRGVKPIITYQHRFTNTYLYGSYSPINGDSFVWEINGVDSKIFEAYLKEFSQKKPDEYKIVVIDNAGFHSTKNIEIPENIQLINIPPYCPELNPCEKVWHYLKSKYKNQNFEEMNQLKDWLAEQVNKMSAELIKSITHDKKYLTLFNTAFGG